VHKGMNEITEMYSAIAAEVPDPADAGTKTNFFLINDLKTADKVVIAGQALSHCVNYTTRDLLANWAPCEAADLVLLSDCSSAVTGCEEAAAQFLEDMRAAGCTVVASAEAVATINK
jgi:nicotinamidase/pyrazinamidase